MADDTTKRLEEEVRQLKESTETWVRNQELAGEIDNLRRRRDAVAKATFAKLSNINPSGSSIPQILSNIDPGTGKRHDIGNIEILMRAMSPLQALPDATWRASTQNKDATALNTLLSELKIYAKNVVEDMASAATGREYRSSVRRGGSDIMRDVFGQSGTWAKESGGLAMDIIMDPSAGFGTTGKMFSVAKKLTTVTKNIASKSATIEKGIDAVGRSFDLYYDLGKSGQKNAEEFRHAVREAYYGGDKSILAKFGIKIPSANITNNDTKIFDTVEQATVNRDLQDTQTKLTNLKKIQDLIASGTIKTKANIGDLIKSAENTLIALTRELRGNKPTLSKAQSLTNLKYGNSLADLGQDNIFFDPIKTKILQNIFGEITKPTGLLGGISKTTNFWKQMVAYDPRWHAGNFMDEMLNSMIAGGNIKDIPRAFNVLKSKGASDPELWKVLGRTGMVSSTGPSEATLAGSKQMASLSQTFPMVLTYLGNLSKGVEKAADIAELTHGNYAKAFRTPFERAMMEVFPWYQYQATQFGRQPYLMSKGQPFFTTMGHVQEATTPEAIKRDPSLRPPYLDKSMIGNVSGFRLSRDDFMEVISSVLKGDWRKLINQITPVASMFTSFVTGRDIRTGREFGPERGAKYEYSDPLIKYMMGYNERTKMTENAKRRYFMESYLGVPNEMWRRAEDPREPGYRMITPIRPYNVDHSTLSWIRDQQPGGGGAGGPGGGGPNTLFSQFSNWLFGTTKPAAATPGQGIQSPQEYIQKFTELNNLLSVMKWSDAKFPIGAVDPREAYKIAPRNLEGTERERAQRAGENLRLGQDLAKTLLNAGPDVGKNMAESFKQEIRNLTFMRDFFGMDPGLVGASAKAAADKYQFLQPKGKGEYFFNDPNLMMAKVSGSTIAEQILLKEQERGSQFVSKTAAMWDQIIEKNSTDVIEGWRKSQLEALNTVFEMNRAKWPKEWQEARMQAINAAAAHFNEELIIKIGTAQTNIIENFAKAIPEGVARINAERESALQRVKSSKDWKVLDDPGRNAALAAINAQYDQKQRERLAAEAKSRADMVSAIYKEEMDATISSLNAIMERGGISIPDFFKRQRAAGLERFRSAGTGAGQIFSAGYNDFNTQEIIGNITESLNTAPSIDEAITAFADLFAAMEKAIADDPEGLRGDMTKLLNAQRNIGELLNQLKDFKAKMERGETDSLQKLNQAYAELSIARITSIRDALKAEAGLSPTYRFGKAGLESVNAMQGGGTMLERVQTFLRGGGTRLAGTVDPMTMVYQENMKKALKEGMKGASRLTTELPASDVDIKAMTTETPEEYYSYLEGQLAKHEENKAMLTEEGARKIASIRDAMTETDRKRNIITMQEEDRVFQIRVQTAVDMNKMLGDTAQMLYEASGKKSKEMFYLMKATALAEAVIKGTQAVINSFNAGSVFGPAGGIAFATIASAFVGAQIGLIAASTIRGYKKGGKIALGTTDTADDVDIRASRDEWIINASSARKYGDNFMDAINKGTLEIGAMHIPSIPSRQGYQAHFAEGGKVVAPSGGQGIIANIINVLDPSEIGRVMASVDGQNAMWNFMTSNAPKIRRMIFRG